jgi:hypothetical protein
MRYALLLLLCTGCNATAAVDHASIIADIAVRYAAIVCRPQPTPTPDTPAEGCVEGCRCNGTGREKTGDGLSEVDCRCAADCECKPKATSTPKCGVTRRSRLCRFRKTSTGRIECRNGTCYWVDDATGQRYRVVR